MKVEQGDIVEINVFLPDGGFKPHPAIVISNNNVYFYESAFIVVMISGVNTDDDFSYHLSDEMLTKKPKKKSQVRCHLINLATKRDVIMKHGKIKKQYLSEIIEKIKSDVLSID
ncbi:MAG: type II toxin-antitoxin system PemK/MazF family toxin [Bacteroidales bacterium]|nr:type II toxin-antitoxin system PemK/MazF family toxin [Bacteroidales bacterium]